MSEKLKNKTRTKKVKSKKKQKIIDKILNTRLKNNFKSEQYS